MKKSAILFLLLSASLWACSGDCLSCHPKLKENILSDERHQPMLGCIKCHKSETGGISECGKDCFSCHPMEKIDPTVKEHEVIKACQACHVSIPKTLTPSIGQSRDDTLRDLLFVPK